MERRIRPFRSKRYEEGDNRALPEMIANAMPHFLSYMYRGDELLGKVGALTQSDSTVPLIEKHIDSGYLSSILYHHKIDKVPLVDCLNS